MSKRNDKMLIRQGDVLLRRVDPASIADRKLVPVPTENGRVVLAHGEQTGHHHSFPAGDTLTLLREPEGDARYLEVTDTVYLEHQEHMVFTAAADVKIELDNIIRNFKAGERLPTALAGDRAAVTKMLEEGAPITVQGEPVQPGLYEVIRQREQYSPSEVRRVED